MTDNTLSNEEENSYNLGDSDGSRTRRSNGKEKHHNCNKNNEKWQAETVEKQGSEYLDKRRP
eukprot:6083065-Ditylum_brightwellii.AAC.1